MTMAREDRGDAVKPASMDDWSKMGTFIDPTARIDAGAELGREVHVGPWCWVGSNVRLGDGCRLDSMVRLDGWTEIGAANHFHHGAVIGSPPQDLKYRGAPSNVVIGDGNVFREYSTVNRATEEGEVTRIGSRCLIMAYAHVAHNCQVGDHAILANSANLAGHVEVGDYAIIGGVTPVHQFVKIGCHSMIGGGCRVPVDVAQPVGARTGPVMRESIPVAVVGCGHLGTFHARLYAQLPEVQLVAVVDTHVERAQALAREVGVEASTDLAAILPRVRAVSIATPTTTHHDIAWQCLDAGVACLVEKPICESAPQGRALVDHARNLGLALAVGHTERFNPAFAAARAELGRPRFIESHRLAPFARSHDP